MDCMPRMGPQPSLVAGNQKETLLLQAFLKTVSQIAVLLTEIRKKWEINVS